MEVVISVDAGTTALKACAISRGGAVLASAEAGIRTHALPAGRVEQDADEWWEAFARALRVVCAGVEAQRLTPVALVLTGQMQDAILVGEDAHPVRRVILYSDTRAGKQADALAARASADGGRPLAERLLGYKGAASLLPKLLWLREHEPATLARAKRLLLGAHSFLCARLLACAGGASARFMCDRTTASVCGLLRPTDAGWALRELGELSGADPAGGASPEGSAGLAWGALLPELVGADASVGAVPAQADGALGGGCGLLCGLPLFHGCGDAGSVTVGVGAGCAGGLYAYLGTSGWVAHTCAPEPAGSPLRPGLFALAHPLPTAASGGQTGAEARAGLVLRAASCVSAGGSAEWLRALLAAALPPGEAGDARPRLSYAAVDALAAQAAPGAGGVLWAPWLGGERSPFTDAAARGCLLGLSHGSGPAEVSRAVLEGVAFCVRALLHAVLPAHSAAEAEAGAGSEARLLVCGGLSRSGLWMQTLADVLGLAVVVAADAEHAGARGAAILAGQPGGLGWFSRLDPPGFCPTGDTYRPTADRAVRRLLDAQYALHAKLHAALRETFAGLAAASAAFEADVDAAQRGQQLLEQP